MSLGTLFFFVALIFFFLAGTGVALPALTAISWGLFSACLGWMLSGVPLKFQ